MDNLHSLHRINLEALYLTIQISFPESPLLSPPLQASVGQVLQRELSTPSIRSRDLWLGEWARAN